VLVAGGISVCNSLTCDPVASAEIYDPQTETWRATTDMPSPRVGHTATLLTSGNVLVAGGCPTNGLPCSSALGAEIYDPSTETWSDAGPMITNRTEAYAVGLASGEVLVAGGLDGSGFPVVDAERYNATTDAWVASGTMTKGRFQSTATPLASGRVLMAGGNTAAAELYIATSVVWAATGSMNSVRSLHAAVLLGNGDALASGGQDPNHNVLASAETYHPGSSALVSIDPTSLDFGLQQVGTMGPARFATITNDGDVTLSIGSLAVNGANPTDFSATLLCGGSVPPGGSCDVRLQFSPTAVRNRNAILTIADNAPTSPQTVSLSGFGFSEASNEWRIRGPCTSSGLCTRRRCCPTTVSW